MITALFLVALSGLPANNANNRPRFATRDCQRSSAGRSTRGLPCGSALAFFEAANASGTGTGAACACTAVTGAKGEGVTWTRGGSAYCTKEGLATTGLTTTSMVLCGSNLPRVAADGSGVLGWLVESSRTNSAIQSEAFENAAWTSTATVTANTTTAPNNTLTADTLSDGSAVAIQSSCQTVATTSAAQHTFSAYLAAGTLAKASISLTGTGSSTGDCTASTTSLASTYSRLSCTSPAAYAGTLTAVTICINTGTVVADTGTIVAFGTQLELAAAYATSYIATTTLAAVRVADANAVNGATFPGAPFSMSAFVTPEWASTGGSGAQGIIEGQVGIASGAGLFFVFGTGAFRFQTLNAGSLNITTTGNTMAAGTAYKVGGANSGGNSSAYFGGVLVSGPTATNNAAQPWSTTTGIGYSPAFPAPLDGIISRVKIDNTATGGL